MAIKAKGRLSGVSWVLTTHGNAAGFVAVSSVVIAGFWNAPDIPAILTLSMVGLFVLGAMFGYRVFGSQTERLESECQRLTDEVNRVGEVKSELQKQDLDNPHSSQE